MGIEQYIYTNVFHMWYRCQRRYLTTTCMDTMTFRHLEENYVWLTVFTYKHIPMWYLNGFIIRDIWMRWRCQNVYIYDITASAYGDYHSDLLNRQWLWSVVWINVLASLHGMGEPHYCEYTFLTIWTIHCLIMLFP